MPVAPKEPKPTKVVKPKVEKTPTAPKEPKVVKTKVEKTPVAPKAPAVPKEPKPKKLTKAQEIEAEIAGLKQAVEVRDAIIKDLQTRYNATLDELVREQNKGIFKLILERLGF